eukprot:gene11692-18033_t
MVVPVGVRNAPPHVQEQAPSDGYARDRDGTSDRQPESRELTPAQRIEEEIACLKTIVHCLSLSLASLKRPKADDPVEGDEHQLSLSDTREFLVLVTNLIDSDKNPMRLRSLLLSDHSTPIHILLDYITTPASGVTPSSAHRETFTEVGYTNIQVQCVQTITKAIATCCASNTNADGIKPLLFQLITSIGAVDTLLKLVASLDESEQLRTSAAECLFVFISKIEEAKEAVVRLHAVAFFLELLWKEPSKMIRNYLCAVLRVVAERYPEQFLDAAFVERSVALLQHEGSKYVAIMLLDVVALIFNRYPTFYDTRVRPSPDIVPALATLCEAVLHRNMQLDIVHAITTLMSSVFSIEGQHAQSEPRFLEVVLSSGSWRTLLGVNSPAPAEWSDEAAAVALAKMACFRGLVENCTTRPMVAALQGQLQDFFPAVSVLLNVPLDDGYPIAFQQEVCLSLALVLVKNPDAR